jgi:hypothetical protein
MILKRSRPTDPLDGSRRAGRAVFLKLRSDWTTRNGTQADAISAAIGAYAGHACQEAAMHGLKTGLPEYSGLSIVGITTTDGVELLSGDAINRPLAERPNSVWEILASGAADHGLGSIDPGDFFQHVASTIGHPEFGIPRGLPSESPSPRALLSKWDRMQRLVRRHAPDPQEWPMAYAFAAQNVFAATDGKVDLSLPFGVIIESAIAMSKVNLAA